MHPNRTLHPARAPWHRPHAGGRAGGRRPGARPHQMAGQPAGRGALQAAVRPDCQLAGGVQGLSAAGARLQRVQHPVAAQHGQLGHRTAHCKQVSQPLWRVLCVCGHSQGVCAGCLPAPRRGRQLRGRVRRAPAAELQNQNRAPGLGNLLRRRPQRSGQWKHAARRPHQALRMPGNGPGIEEPVYKDGTQQREQGRQRTAMALTSRCGGCTGVSLASCRRSSRASTPSSSSCAATWRCFPACGRGRRTSAPGGDRGRREGL